MIHFCTLIRMRTDLPSHPWDLKEYESVIILFEVSNPHDAIEISKLRDPEAVNSNSSTGWETYDWYIKPAAIRVRIANKKRDMAICHWVGLDIFLKYSPEQKATYLSEFIAINNLNRKTRIDKIVKIDAILIDYLDATGLWNFIWAQRNGEELRQTELYRNVHKKLEEKYNTKGIQLLITKK